MKSLLTTVLDHAEARPSGTAFWCLSARRGDTSRTWSEVARDAGHAAAAFHERGVQRGDVVILIGTHHADFYAAWLGASWLGAVPTVLAEPGVRIHKDLYAQRLAALLARIEAKAIVHDPRVAVPLEAGGDLRMRYDEVASFAAAPPALIDHASNDLLLLQHSSGTTGLQKGVMLSHGAVAAHAAAYAKNTELGSDDVIATWLPLYHDMGLVACFLGSLFAGASVAWLSPFEWVASPQSLLDAVARFGATHAWLPNFAFHFLAQRTRTAGPLASLRHVVNCSEVVTADSFSAFAERFSANGFERGALATCYAMAENVFAMTSTTRHDPPRRRSVLRDRFRNDHVAELANAVAAVDGGARDAPVLTHLSSGPPIESVSIKLVDDAGAHVDVGRVGRILVKSPFLFDGYYKRPDLNQSLFDADGYFDTGDLGYIDVPFSEGGHLFVTGRKKDIIIAAGKNIYPQDVEAVADVVDGISAGRAVAFGVALKTLGTDGVVVLAESKESAEHWPELQSRLRTAVTTSLDVDLVDVRLVAPQSLRKSTSGKLARGGNREWYLAGRFGAVPDNVEADSEDGAS